MAITWQQVAAPDMTDVSRMLNVGANQTADALKNLSSAFDPIKQAAANTRKDLVEKNTLNAINEINSISDMGQLDSYLKNTGPQQLIDRFGQDNIDLNKVLSTAAGARDSLTTRLNNQFQFGENQLKQTEVQNFRDISEKIGAAKASGDLDALVPLAQALKSQYGVDAVKDIEAKRAALDNEKRARTTFEQTERTYKTAQEKEQYAKDKGGWYAGLFDRIAQSNLAGTGAIDGELNNLKIQPFYALATPEEQRAMLTEFGNRVMFDPSNPEFNPAMRNEAAKLKLANKTLLDPLESESATLQTALDKRTKEYNKYSQDTDNGAQFSFMGAVKNVAGGKGTDDFGIDDASSLKQDDVVEINNAVTESLTALKSQVIEEQFNEANKKLPLYKKMEALAKEKFKTQIPNAAQVRVAGDEILSGLLTDGVILKALKNSDLGNPWGGGELDINKDSLMKNLKIQMYNYQQVQEDIPKLSDAIKKAATKVEQQKIKNTNDEAVALQNAIRKGRGK